MKRLPLLLLAALPAFSQCPTGTAYPGALDTNATLTLAKNNIITTLTVNQQPTDTVAIVASTTGWAANMMAAVDTGAAIEYEFVTSTSGANTLNVSRACEGSTAVLHLAGAPVDNNATAYSGHTSVAGAVTAVETLIKANPTAHNIPVAEGTSPFTYLSPGTAGQLLTSNGASADPTFQAFGPGAGLPTGTQLQTLRIQPNTGNNTTLQFTAPPQINVNDYNFPAQTPGGSISVGNNTVTLTPCPLGVNGTDTGHYLEISGGVGTAEAAPITGGSCTSGATTGNVILNAANTHSGAFQITSATAGCGEATSATPNGATLLFQPITYVFNGSCNFTAWHKFVGASRGFLNTSVGTVIDARTVPTTLAAFQFLSVVMGAGYDVDSGIVFQDMSMECFRCILINNETIPSFQGNIKNVIIYHVRMNGTYATATDANRFSNVIPTLTTLRTFGTLISCTQCFDADFFNLELENGGLAIFIQAGDINTIEGSTRFNTNGVNVWVDGTGLSGEGAGTNKIINNDMLGNQRIPNIMANGVINLSVFNNYFEEYCPSAQFLRSVGSTGVRFISNRIDDPANAGLCVASGGPNTTSTTPIIHLEDFNSDIVSGNFLNIGASNIPPLEIAYTNWNALRPNFVSCTGNNAFFPCPDGQFNIPTGVFYALAPGVVSTPATNPYLVKASNVASDAITNTCASSFASVWHQSAVLKQADNATFRWVMNTGTCSFTFKLQNQEFFNYLFQFTARKLGAGTGFVSIVYTDAAGTNTTLFSGNLNWVATTEVETRNVLVQLPAAAVGPGKLVVAVDGSTGEYEQIEVIPQTNYQNTLVGSAVASAATITPTSGLFHITGTTAIVTINVPAGFFSGNICAIPDGLWTTTNAGNIAIASTAVVSKQLCWQFDPNTAKWYPSY